LGERFARVLHAVGARVVVVARRRDRLEKLAADLAGSHVVVADLASPDDRERAVAAAIDAFGTVDVLVNNAGISGVGAIEEESLDTFRRVIEVNLTAVWHLTKLAGVPM